jgi:hypothetical protein
MMEVIFNGYASASGIARERLKQELSQKTKKSKRFNCLIIESFAMEIIQFMKWGKSRNE